MKILENQSNLFEKTVMQPLSSDDLYDVNGGWCLILICGVNFSVIFGPVINDEIEKEALLT